MADAQEFREFVDMIDSLLDVSTNTEGSVVKYLTPAESLVKKYDLDLYLKQTIDLTRRRVEEVFGKDPHKQLGLGEWF